MTHEMRAKDFATWIIIHTKPVETIGVCRSYKNRVLTVDELYDAWVEFKNEHLKKF
jgi:hypothetical protein